MNKSELQIQEYIDNKPKKDIKHWKDLWFQPDKSAGYAIIANEKYYNKHIIGYHNQKDIDAIAKLKIDRYISINAFEVKDFSNIKNVRKTDNLKQIRMIAIDIDQYNLGLTIAEARDEIFNLIRNGEIPTPNLVCQSHGIQLFYSLDGGLSPHRTLLATYITQQLIEKLKHIGADGRASDMARLMRLPGSYNSRNGSRVHWEIWNKSSYSHFDLLRYIPKYKPKQFHKAKTNRVLSFNLETTLMNRTNNARLHDFEKLIHLRKFNLTRMRNIMMYNYSFHLSLIEQDESNVLDRINELFSKITTNDSKQREMSQLEIKLTVNSAFKDAKNFLEYYVNNDYKIEIKSADGIIKPKLTETIIRELDITTQEQMEMKTLARPTILKKKRNAKRKKDIIKERREKGIKSMGEYNKARKSKKEIRLEKLKDLMEKQPHATQQEYADILDVNRSTISRDMKSLKQL